MKSTEQFKSTIQSFLDEMASKDPVFAERLKREDKNIENCITYILNAVKKRQRQRKKLGKELFQTNEKDLKKGRFAKKEK